MTLLHFVHTQKRKKKKCSLNQRVAVLYWGMHTLVKQFLLLICIADLEFEHDEGSLHGCVYHKDVRQVQV